MKEYPIATNRPTLYTGNGTHRHCFWDYQFCLKCGKWECAPEADDCEMSDLDYDNFAKGRSKSERAA